MVPYCDCLYQTTVFRLINDYVIIIIIRLALQLGVAFDRVDKPTGAHGGKSWRFQVLPGLHPLDPSI